MDILASESPTGTLRGWFVTVIQYGIDRLQILIPDSNSTQGIWLRKKNGGNPWFAFNKIESSEVV